MSVREMTGVLFVHRVIMETQTVEVLARLAADRTIESDKNALGGVTTNGLTEGKVTVKV